LDKLETLRPEAVIAGHKVPENDDHPRIIAETRQYLRDFNRLNESTSTARELYDAMLALYPNRANPGRCGEEHIRQRSWLSRRNSDLAGISLTEGLC